MTMTFIYNQNLMNILNGISPMEKLFRISLKYDKLMVFGCKAFLCMRSHRENKLDDKSSNTIFLAIRQLAAVASLYLETKKNVVLGDVIFVEDYFS